MRGIRQQGAKTSPKAKQENQTTSVKRPQPTPLPVTGLPWETDDRLEPTCEDLREGAEEKVCLLKDTRT